jgi:tRNA threonylcarbamoyladenosine biosynthesis protein TsaB
MKKEHIHILSIETSGKTCGVTLMRDNITLFSENITESNQHDKMLASLVQSAMKHSSNDFTNLDAIAVSAGPGSFTGLRIGTALAKGIVFDSGIKFIAVPTLDAIAWHYIGKLNLDEEKNIISVIPSHKNLFYIKLFDKNFNTNGNIELINPDNMRYFDAENCIFVGSGAYIFHDDNKKEVSNELNSEIIANYAYKLYLDNNFTDADDFIPMYAQDFIPKTTEETK